MAPAWYLGPDDSWSRVLVLSLSTLSFNRYDFVAEMKLISLSYVLKTCAVQWPIVKQGYDYVIRIRGEEESCVIDSKDIVVYISNRREEINIHIFHPVDLDTLHQYHPNKHSLELRLTRRRHQNRWPNSILANFHITNKRKNEPTRSYSPPSNSSSRQHCHGLAAQCSCKQAILLQRVKAKLRNRFLGL